MIIFINRTITIPVVCNQEDYNYLLLCQKESARVWNDCINMDYIAFENGYHISKKDLSFMNKGYSEILGSHTVQVMYFKYFAMRKAAIMSRRSGRTDVRFPYKQKEYWNTCWDYMSFRKNKKSNSILIARPKKNGKVQQRVKIKTKIQIPDNMYRCELIYKGNKLWLAINYRKEVPDTQPTGNLTCGVDLGEIHSIAAVDSNGDKLIITGRKLRSYYRFYNKEIDKLNQALKRCKKGSVRYWKLRRAVKKLIFKRDCKVNYHLNVTSCRFVDWCYKNGISQVFIGDLSNFNMNLNAGKQNQRLSNWAHGKLLAMIQDKCLQIGIQVDVISEHLTSQTCNSCGSLYKPSNRNYTCSCGYAEHRDINGAINILSKGLNTDIVPLHLPEKQMTYLRVA